MYEKSLPRDKTHHQIWIHNETFEELEKLRIRDESINSIVGYLIEFHKNALPQIGGNNDSK